MKPWIPNQIENRKISTKYKIIQPNLISLNIDFIKENKNIIALIKVKANKRNKSKIIF